MPANSWPENDSYSELDAIGSLLSDLSEPQEVLVEKWHSKSNGSCYEGRRRKAAVVLTIVWSGTIALHLVSWGSWFVLGLTTMFGIHVLRVVFARPHSEPKPLSDEDLADCPHISLLVAAKNEEAVIGNLIRELCSLDYPDARYEVWVIDDNSTDKTPVLLEQMQREYEHLKVLRRPVGAGGGKSGALNQVLPLTQGEILAVFDADAQVSPDLLRRVLPLFKREEVGAVQVRKVIANANTNFWTQGQLAEVTALDTYVQQQRVAIGGIGELRGNGQFIRRTALERCNGWNEQTITDDLDLTFRLHLDRWDIEVLGSPAVEEEGVTSAISLWHQRNRWAEGGYQRYLDYWRPIVRNRMGTRKTFDLFIFMLSQYILPTAGVPDVMMAIARNRPPVLMPVTSLWMTLSLMGMFIGLRRVRKSEKLSVSTFFVTLLQALHGTTYMLHWLAVIASTTARMSVRPKRLKWVKTIHRGGKER
ncbi:MAG: glycosyltransferase family 2 protein [Chroococcidiopsidaceae cyanobacterium CP_BM_RX_35]|nr:glycosyltransferase family 2 protein [Chroococcidiopsidaceae cyanobacterium CP_BM_RX_35]